MDNHCSKSIRKPNKKQKYHRTYYSVQMNRLATIPINFSQPNTSQTSNSTPFQNHLVHQLMSFYFECKKKSPNLDFPLTFYVFTPIYLIMRQPNEVEYNKTSLMANWYEDRLAPKQLQRDPNATKALRSVEQGISIPGDNGCLLPLPRVARNPHYITKDIIIPDDGYREFRTEFQTKFDTGNIKNMQLNDCRPLIKSNGQRVAYPECNSTVAQTGGSKTIQQLDQTNMQQVLVDRAVHTHFTDFGSTFRNHPEQHNKFYAITTYNQSFQPPTNEVKDILTQPIKRLKAGGCRERNAFDSGLKMTSALTGEKYRNDKDPKDNTEVQRAWAPGGDPGLTHATQNLRQSSMEKYKQNTNQVYPYDIATSLPMEDGVYNLHSKYTNPGQFRHIRSDVTVIRNKPITRK